MRSPRRLSAMTAFANALRGHSHSGVGAWQRLGAFPRMVRMARAGGYGGLSGTKMFLMVLAALYIVSPIDAIPEAPLLLLGLGDDAMIAAWLAGAVMAETDMFLDWEKHGGAAFGPGTQPPGAQFNSAPNPDQSAAESGHTVIRGEVIK